MTIRAPGAGLKPCPYCGPGQSVVRYYDDHFKDGTMYHAVACGRCGAHSGVRPQSDPDGKEKVIDSWNNRPVEAAKDAQIAVLQRRITDLLESNNRYEARYRKAKEMFRDIFLAGAKWWEWHKTGLPVDQGGIGASATMWQSDQRLVVEEFDKRLADGKYRIDF